MSDTLANANRQRQPNKKRIIKEQNENNALGTNLQSGAAAKSCHGAADVLTLHRFFIYLKLCW